MISNYNSILIAGGTHYKKNTLPKNLATWGMLLKCMLSHIIFFFWQFDKPSLAVWLSIDEETVNIGL